LKKSCLLLTVVFSLVSAAAERPFDVYGDREFGGIIAAEENDAGIIMATAATDSNTTLIGRWANGPCYGVAVRGDTAYFGNGGYLEIVDFSDPANPIELGKIVLPSTVKDIVLSNDYAYVVEGYAGLRIIDVSDPANPTESGFYDTGGYAKGVAISGNYAFVADGTEGLRIIDISDPANPTESGYYDTGGLAYGVAVSGNYAYVADNFKGLH